MQKKNIQAGLILLVASSLILAACSNQTPTPAATIDANMIYTQAAQTVQAGMAQPPVVEATAAPTETQAATATMDPNIALALTATAQSVQPGKPAATTAGQAAPATTGATATATKLVLPTATKAVVVTTPKSSGDKAELVSQDPTDGTSVGKGDVITTTITLKNTGTTTWKKGTYGLAFYAGDRLGSPADFEMTKDVAPGDTIALVFQLTAPNESGNKKVIWVVHNADAVNFYSLWLELHIN